MTIEDPRLMDALSVWAAETTTQLLASINVDSIDTASQNALRAMQSVNAKIAQSRANPIWEEQIVSATVAARDGTTGLRVGSEFLVATGAASATLKDRVGSRVIARGYAKVPGSFEVTSFIPRKDNTLEVVVMSQCPYGASAAEAVLRFIDNIASDNAGTPKIEFRYLFYKRAESKSAGETWWCLHGEPELHENVVQIVIRESLPAKHPAYVRARAADLQADWRAVAAKAGLTSEDIAFVDATATTDRDSIIASEFDYVSKTLGTTDGSPTFFWESQRVTDIASVRAFEAIDLNALGSCGSPPVPRQPASVTPSTPTVAAP